MAGPFASRSDRWTSGGQAAPEGDATGVGGETGEPEPLVERDGAGVGGVDDEVHSRHPEGDQLVGALRYYRWRKWLERVRADDFTEIWEPTARWIASEYDHRSSPVREVALIRSFHEDALSGPQPPYRSFTYFVLRIAPDGTTTSEYPLSTSTTSTSTTSTSTTVPAPTSPETGPGEVQP